MKPLSIVRGASRGFAAAALSWAAVWPAAADCVIVAPAPESYPASPGHHPVDRAMPQAGAFRQPDGCADGFWFFDQNQDGLADASEPRLFGSDRVVACASCHGDAPVPDSATASRVFLRQDASRLCLVCHNL